MYATIQRFTGQGVATADALSAVKQLAAELSRQAGFVSFALLEVDGRIDTTITIFERADDLNEADRVTIRWATEHQAGWLCEPAHVTSGEIVVQRGI
jgi:hypothetical protein